MKKDSKTAGLYAAARAALEKIAGDSILQDKTATAIEKKALSLDMLGAALTRRVKDDVTKRIGVYEVSPIDLNAYGDKIKHANEYRKKQEEEQAKEAEKKREAAKAAGVNGATAKSEPAKADGAKPAPAKAEEVKTPTTAQKAEEPAPAPATTPEPAPAPFFLEVAEPEGGIDYQATVKVMQAIASITLSMLDSMEAQGK
ncbi:MAG: hypothetical protein IJ308_08915 [Clostridia bacterium]|nr:hypothetical protein [Clostridia bacterium]